MNPNQGREFSYVDTCVCVIYYLWLLAIIFIHTNNIVFTKLTAESKQHSNITKNLKTK